MMAAILFSFLLLGVNSEAAPLLETLEPASIARQPLLIAKSESLGREIPAYRGGAQQLIRDTVFISAGGTEGAGVVLDLESVKTLLPNLTDQFLSSRSFILTNFHVVGKGNEIRVMFAPSGHMTLDNSQQALASIFAVIPRKDLALLTVPSKPIFVTGAKLGSVEALSIGDDVQAIGHPLGTLWTYTRGYISQLRTDFQWDDTLVADVIQTQTPISAGNSGGGLFDRNGKLIGINSFSIDKGQNLNFSIAANEFAELENAATKSATIRSIGQTLTWQAIDKFLALSEYRLIETGRETNNLYKIFQREGEARDHIVARFTDKKSSPLLIQAQEFKNKIYKLLFSSEHENPSAFFRVRLVDSADNTVFQGWDFNGDLVIDYLM